MSKIEKKETPAAVIKWNWGAFVFGWIWGMFNNVWISFLTLIPMVGFVMAIVLGVKGNQWAWEKSSETDVQVFLKRQRKWNIAAAIYALIVLLIIGIFFVIGITESNKNTTMVLNSLNSNNEVIKLLGSPIKGDSRIKSDYSYSSLKNGKWGELDFYEIDVEGSKTSAHVIEVWLNYDNKKSLVLLKITPKSAENAVLLITPQDNPATADIVNELLDKLESKKD